MRTARIAKIALALVAAAPFTASAFADSVVPDGTVSSSVLFNPTVNLTSSPYTYSAMSGATFEISGTGGFTNVANTYGTLNGTLTFSNMVGTTTTESLNNFFVFSDGMGGSYDFSVDSVRTDSFVNQPGVTSGVNLYLLGTTLDSNLGYTSTPTSLTIQANNTGNSAFSSSATLAIPPAGGTSVTPEPTSLVLLGTGMLGIAGVARRRFSL